MESLPSAIMTYVVLKSLGEDIYGLQNPGKFPLRCPYGNDDTTTNPNIQAAYGDGQYVFTETMVGWRNSLINI